LVLVVVAGSLLGPYAAGANPYLAKPGEPLTAVRAATCAASGGFVHLYAAVDYGLFDKYGLKVEHTLIRGSSVSLAALSADEIQFLYCAADATIPGLASGVDAKIVGATLVGLPWVVLARQDVKKPEDLRGKAIGVSRPGQLTYRLAKAFVKKFNMENDVQLRPVGEGQVDGYKAMVAGIVQAAQVTPPLDVQGKREGFNVIYNLNDLELPAVYSSVHTNAKSLRERGTVVQKFVAAMAEAIHFVEKNPDKAKASLAKVLKIDDQETLQSAYEAYANSLVNRRMIVPANAIADAVEVAREAGANIKRKPSDLFDNSFAEHLEKSGFLRLIWGETPRR
jgi:ABC-type nitrate/sulfonate/bicarbonate transport system substrate-binding protein